MKTRVLYTKPSITQREVDYATDAAANGWGAKCYEYIERFERLFCDYLGSKYALATSSCTGALHLGMSALEVGLGDEVILADTNWIAAPSVVTHLGAKPIFVDVLEDSWCIDPEAVEKAINSKTKAIVVTHLYGNLCDMDRLLAIGKKYGIPIVEDAAEALGSAWSDCKAGTRGRFGVFSFHGTKTMTTGEGGMFVTDDKDLMWKVQTLNNHGRVPGETHQFWSQVAGFKYKISNIQAAIGCGQVERLPELVERKRQIFRYYKDGLTGLGEISLNPEPTGTINSAWMPTAVFSIESNVTRDQLLSAFSQENIDARVFFHPVSSMPMFEDVPGNRVAHSLHLRAINLPSYHDMTNEDMDRVIATLRSVLEKSKSGIKN